MCESVCASACGVCVCEYVYSRVLLSGVSSVSLPCGSQGLN